MCKRYWLYFCVFEFLTFSVADQVSIRVEGEEDEREVAPIIVIQTPDPLLRLQVYWSSMLSIVILCYRYPRPLTKGSGQLVLRQYPMFPIIKMFTVFTKWNCQVKWKSMVITGEAAKIKHEDKFREKAATAAWVQVRKVCGLMHVWICWCWWCWDGKWWREQWEQGREGDGRHPSCLRCRQLQVLTLLWGHYNTMMTMTNGHWPWYSWW